MKRSQIYAFIILLVIGIGVIWLIKLVNKCTQPLIVYVTPNASTTFVPAVSNTPTYIVTQTVDATVTTTNVANLPSPTATLSTDYAELAKIYLQTPTPYPTHPTPTPQPSTDLLSQVKARKLPSNWTPVPFQFIDYNNNQSDWQVTTIQITTDLMNWVNADPVQFWRQIKSLQPEETWFGDSYEWLMEDDFDGDHKQEWLVSVPVYPADKEIRSFPEQVIILFELEDGIYQPVMYHRTFLYGGSLHGYFAKVLLVQDLNKNGLKEIVWRYTTCGSACSETIQIGEWDGENWQYVFWDGIPGTNLTNYFMFTDQDSDGIVEISVNYTTFYKLNGRYPDREARDTYKWKNGQWELVEEWRSPSADSYAIMYDVFSALELGKYEQAIEFGQPVLGDLQNTCGPVETYTGLEIMLAHTILNKPEAAGVVLQQLDTYCNSTENIFLPAAHVYMQAYQQTGDAVASCSAMNRFILKTGTTNYIEMYRSFGNGYIATFCPISPSWQ